MHNVFTIDLQEGLRLPYVDYIIHLIIHTKPNISNMQCKKHLKVGSLGNVCVLCASIIMAARENR